ncbi:MAG TPA: putative LPS assembly protein LptD, partial [Sphingobacteriaceae bacterium]|nr:putative LPS assembly protein LptD [Sphingobacteriaceae bacterium]
MKLIDRIFKLILFLFTFAIAVPLLAKEEGRVGVASFLQAQDTIVATQKDTLLKDSSLFLDSSADSVLAGLDTVNVQIDTVGTPGQDENGLSSPVFTTADDSTRMDYQNNVLYLYGNAKVKFEDFELTADFIRVDRQHNLIFASGAHDHNKRYRGRPIFKSATEPPTTTDSLYYNIETKKGKTFNVFSEVDGGFIQAKQLKNNQYNEAFIKDAMYSTCNLPEPHTHFGIYISKGIVSEKNIVSGPAYLVIEDVPIPFIMVPFGFFPKNDKRASGFMFPSFGEDYTRGFFMRDLGWYFGFNDYWDMELRGTLYSKGS